MTLLIEVKPLRIQDLLHDKPNLTYPGVEYATTRDLHRTRQVESNHRIDTQALSVIKYDDSQAANTWPALRW